MVKVLLDHARAAAPLGIPAVDPSANDNEALHQAIWNNHIEIVKLLRDHVNS
ncbi:hypothetical protein HDU96_007473 [Phlyctochytrium bullatum]|nr:hypothetical protein HDU96_007473 [Phlyctochytrium bullatum]